MSSYKRRIAGVMMPRDLEEIRKIENKLQLSKHDITLKQEYDQCLKRCVCVELIQIKDFLQIQPDLPSSGIGGAGGPPGHISRQLEVRTTGSFAASENRLSSDIIFIGQIKLKQWV